MSRSFIEIIKIAALEAISNLKACDVLFGTVIQEKTDEQPLIIETDDHLTLTEAFLVLARNVTDHQTWISFDNPEIKQKIKIYDKAEKESEAESLPEAILSGDEPHRPRDDDTPEPEEEKTTDIVFLKKWYENTLKLKDENGDTPEKIELPAYHEITIYNHLRLDERVILIRQEGGQRFLVIDRIDEEAAEKNATQ